MTPLERSVRGAPQRLAAVVLAIACAMAVLARPAIARADEPPKQEELPRRSVTFKWSKPDAGPSALTATFSYRDIVDKAVEEKLKSGLPVVIAMRAYLLREGEASPVALAVRTCRVSYDLWEEAFRLKISTPDGERNLATEGLRGVIRNCAEAVDVPVAERSLLVDGKVHFLGVIVEVNPVSPQMLEQMRKWVSRPAGSTGIGPGDALFGSFVGLFVRPVGTADRTLRFRTQAIP